MLEKFELKESDLTVKFKKVHRITGEADVTIRKGK
jgi:activator of HSP90 ATPase